MPEYLCIGESGELPDLNPLKPFKSMVIIETVVSQKRQDEVSEWLVRSGCRYMMALGPGCSSWDDSVDIANLERFGFAEILDKEFVMTTWHEQETLDDVFHFAPTAAITYDQSEELPNALFLHLGAKDKRDEFEKRYEAATSIS